MGWHSLPPSTLKRHSWHSTSSFMRVKSRRWQGHALFWVLGGCIYSHTPSGCWQNIVPRSCRTEVPVSRDGPNSLTHGPLKAPNGRWTPFTPWWLSLRVPSHPLSPPSRCSSGLLPLAVASRGSCVSIVPQAIQGERSHLRSADDHSICRGPSQ